MRQAIPLFLEQLKRDLVGESRIAYCVLPFAIDRAVHAGLEGVLRQLMGLRDALEGEV